MRRDRIGARARGVEIDVESAVRTRELQLAAGAFGDVEPRLAEHAADRVGAVSDQHIILHRPHHRRRRRGGPRRGRSEEHTSELQSLMRISYAVFCLKKKKKKNTTNINTSRS